MSRLEGKVAIITGAASRPGLGSATAIRFAREGAKLVLTDINEEELKGTVEEVKKAGGEVLSWRQDATSEEDWKATIERTLDAWGKLDILVNNAGIAVLGPLEDMTAADYERQMQVNMTSVFLGTRAAITPMRKNGSGSIINMSSVLGLVGVPGGSLYAASKGGVRLFSKSVALECARDNVRCNSVHPGVIWTNIQKEAMKDNPEQYEIINNSIPMGRMGDAEDIANSVLFLASDEAKYITGAEFVVDGGLTAQ